jgi:AraC family transcriptional activator of pobA
MPNSAPPEVICERLSERRPEAFAQLLAAARYRQYVFLFTGKGEAQFDGRREPLTPGTTLSIPAQTICKLQFDKNADGIWFAILEEFQASRVIPAIPAMTKPRSPFWNMYYAVSLRRELTGAARRAARKKVMHDLLSARDRLGMDSDPIVVGYMSLILFAPSRKQLMNPASTAPTQHRVADNELVLAFRQLIEKHYREHWNSDRYCKILGVTQRRLLSACKHVTGKFPKALIHERVMREAHANLIYSNKSISEIAYGLGFESAAYFSHFYKRNTGISPRQELQRLGCGDKS